MARFRSHGWDPKELKIYWNLQQLENLCPKPDAEENDKNDVNNEEPEHDPSDADVVLALRQYPVSKRNYDCKIKYINTGIENAVFDAPEHAQLIVLNFAVSLLF
jgi:hypothetical protein